MRNFVILVASSVVFAITVMWEGYVLSILWKWFAMPLFNGLPALSLVHAIGISALVGLLTHQGGYKKPTEEESIRIMVYGVINPTFVLLIGWIASLSMK